MACILYLVRMVYGVWRIVSCVSAGAHELIMQQMQYGLQQQRQRGMQN